MKMKTNMKRVTLFIVGMVLIAPVWAQPNDAISRFFSKYADDESFTVVTVTSKMFSLFAELDPEDPDEKEAMEAISKIKGLKILALEDDSLRAPGVFQEAQSLIPSNEYEDLMTVRHEGKDMNFMIKESKGIISELLLLAGGDKDFFIMSLVGEIDLAQISKLSGKMRIDGFENLKLLDEERH